MLAVIKSKLRVFLPGISTRDVKHELHFTILFLIKAQELLHRKKNYIHTKIHKNEGFQSDMTDMNIRSFWAMRP